MLNLLKIKNFAIIDSLEIEFSEGLNVISGETGTGKSIVIGAISVVLGSRAHEEMIQSGKSEASIEALFELNPKSHTTQEIKKSLINAGLEGFEEADDCAENSLIIKRIISKSGKNRIYINGQLATLALLKTVTSKLVDLCGQHEHQKLTANKEQMALIDRFAGNTSELSELGSVFDKIKITSEEIDSLDDPQSKREIEFLRFQLTEIDQLAPMENEDEDLKNKREELSGSFKLTEIFQEVDNALMDSANSSQGQGSASVVEILGKTEALLEKAIEIDPAYIKQKELITIAISNCEDVSFNLRSTLNNIDSNSSELEEIEDRLDKITKLKRKNSMDLSEIIVYAEELRSKLEKFDNLDETVAKLRAELKNLQLQYIELFKIIRAKREKASAAFSSAISTELSELNMNDSEIKVMAQELPQKEWGRSGMDRLQFYIRTNPGEPLKPMSQIASGGELSRITLAIRRVISGAGETGVYLFDEVDSGIGGKTGTLVGKKLKSVSKDSQVLCITHLPQVAAFADHHLVVEKKVLSGRTFSTVRNVQKTERVQEIARMFGGLTSNSKKEQIDVAMKHAQTLISESTEAASSRVH